MFTSRILMFNENIIPDFHNETEYIEDRFLYLDLDEEREELQDTSILSQLDSEDEITDKKCVEKVKTIQKLKLNK